MEGFWEGLFLYAMVAIVLALFCWLGWSVYKDSTSPTFALIKTEWVCTDRHEIITNTYNPALKINQVQVIDICDNYHRVGR